MPQFKDMKGRAWGVDLSIGLASRIRQNTGVDFLAPELGKALRELAADPMKLVGVLWECCAEQAERSGVTPEDMGMSLGGDSLSDASEALMEALVLFTRRPLRPAAKRAMELGKEAERLLMERAGERLAKPGLAVELADALEAELTPGAESGKLPESSGSTPDP